MSIDVSNYCYYLIHKYLKYCIYTHIFCLQKYVKFLINLYIYDILLLMKFKS